MILSHTRMPVPSPGLKRKMLHVSIAFLTKNTSSKFSVYSIHNLVNSLKSLIEGVDSVSVGLLLTKV